MGGRRLGNTGGGKLAGSPPLKTGGIKGNWGLFTRGGQGKESRGVTPTTSLGGGSR